MIGLFEESNNRYSKTTRRKHGVFRLGMVVYLFFFMGLIITVTQATELVGELTYQRLAKAAADPSDSSMLTDLNRESQKLAWEKAVNIEFVGNLRFVESKSANAPQAESRVYLLRKLSGELLILSLPDRLEQDPTSPYFDLTSALESKMVFQVQTLEATVAGHSFHFARLIEKPEHLLTDRIFKISITLMLFFVMVGMGMTLTIKDFALVFKKPKGIVVGQILQFGFMPLLAMVLGRLLGFYDEYPFIFVGLILITAIPGGVTSNLMTYYAKGDLALSISLTSFSTVLSIVFTPLLLALYCADLPEIAIPVKIVIQTIMILVIVPLIVGMSLRWKWPSVADKATPFFSALGIFALLVLIIAGVLNNLNIFVDTTRYGFKFYLTIFTVTMLGMVVGLLVSKLMGINNYQTRAISLETGLRNSALAMTIALLIQDTMGDFFSSMFVTSGIFGLVMYLAGLLSIYFYPRLLPVEADMKLPSKTTP